MIDTSTDFYFHFVCVCVCGDAMVLVRTDLVVIVVTLKGLFMALQPKIIACGNSVASFAMAVRFLTGPAVMAAASIAVGLRGRLLHIAIVQVIQTLMPILTMG